MRGNTPLTPVIFAKFGKNQPLTPQKVVDATAAMTPEQAAQTRQNIGADTPETVTAWLDAHVDPDTGYVIDNSLTVEGAAADAKATGDEIGDLKSAMHDKVPFLSVSGENVDLVIGRAISSSGEISNNTPTSSLSGYIEVHENECYEFPAVSDENNIPFVFFIATFSAQNISTFIERINVTGSRYTIGASTKYIRIAFLRSASTGVTLTQTDIDTYFHGKLYNVEQTICDNVNALLPLKDRQIWFEAGELPLKWTLGRIITSEGEITNNVPTSAISDYYAVNENECYEFSAIKDANNVPINVYAAMYSDRSTSTFISRVQFNNGKLIIDGETKFVRFVFARSGSTGITMTQADIDTYFHGNVYQVGERVQTVVQDAENNDEFEPFNFAGTWEMSYTVTANGTYASSNTYAASRIVERGDIIGFKTLEIRDNEQNQFITFVVCYDKYQRFMGRFSGVVVFSPEVRYYRLVFGRASSTGITPTQNTINTYFSINAIRKPYLYSGKAPVWDKPANYGVLNCILRAKQLVYLTYTTKAILPNQVADFPAGTNVTGAPYSSARLYDKFIGLNVSLHTFMTAINNPNSVVYTEALETPNAKTFYGTVCSSFTAYALASPVREVTKKILSNITDYTTKNINDIQLGDICVNDGHIILIGGIERDQYGRITNVITLESLPPKCCLTSYTWSAFVSEVAAKDYRVASYNDIQSVNYIRSDYVALMDEEPSTITYSPICTNYGDAPLLKAGETIKVQVLNATSATGITITKDGESFGSYSVQTVTLTDLQPGKYVASLLNGATVLGTTTWDVCSAEVSKAGTRVSFGSFENCTPLYISFNDASGTAYYCIPLTAEDIESGYVDTDYSGTGVNVLKIYVENGDSSTAFTTDIS